MDEFELGIIKFKLERLFSMKSYSIRMIDQICEILYIDVSQETDYIILNTIDLINYDHFTNNMYNHILLRTINLIKGCCNHDLDAMLEQLYLDLKKEE